MSTVAQEYNFDTFLFPYTHCSQYPKVMADFSMYITECYIEGVLENVVRHSDFIDLDYLLAKDINATIWHMIHETGSDIMLRPDEYDLNVVECYHNNQKELAAALYMTLLQMIDGMVRYLPEILGNAALKNVEYNDFRFTSDADRYILRMIRKPNYAC